MEEWGGKYLQHHFSDGDKLQPPMRTRTSITSSGTTILTIYPATKTWWVEHGTNTKPFGPLTGATYAGSLKAGSLRILATGRVIDGHRTIELTDKNRIQHVWVDAATYLPIQVVIGSSAEIAAHSTAQIAFTYLAPTRQALNMLALPIPVGYREVPVPQGTPNTGNSGP